MYIVGDDPALADPGAAEALARLDFLVVQDTFLSETAQLAEVVLPATSPVEKNGTFTNNDRHIQRVRAVVAPVGQSRADDDIIRSLARRFGYEMGFRHAAEIMDEIAAVVPGYAGVTYYRLEQASLQWPVADAESPGTSFLHGEGFATADGLAAFVPVVAAVEPPTAEQPFQLVLGDSLYQWRTGVLTQRSQNLKLLEGDPRVEMHPADAEQLRVATGDWVIVRSPFGAVRLRALVTEATQPGVLYTDAQWASAPTALVTAPLGTTSRKAVAVSVLPEGGTETGATPGAAMMHAGTGRAGVL
jgi:predicted molibdopterin-dependent oxidoreductase YjgC